MCGRPVSVQLRRPSLMLILFCLALIGTTFSINNSAIAETTTFTSETPFRIPNYNSTLFFTENGTYSQAILDNDTWVFKGLTLSNSVHLSIFNVSAQNCNITIYFSGLFRGYLRAQDSGLLQYNVTGDGIQRFNFGLGHSFGTNIKYRDLFVRFSSEFFTNNTDVIHPGEGWDLATDGTITVRGATTGVSIMYVDFTNQYTDSTLPFYMQHWVTITAVSLFLAMIAIGVVLRFKTQKTLQMEAKQ
jgi:hypothetical protein